MAFPFHFTLMVETMDRIAGQIEHDLQFYGFGSTFEIWFRVAVDMRNAGYHFSPEKHPYIIRTMKQRGILK